MAEIKTVPTVLEVIKRITSNRESGRLDISSFGTHGTLLFNEGKLVDARLESLSGFQAVNAAVSLRNVELSFDHVEPVAHSSAITVAERVVLQRFFGIEAAEIEEPNDEVEPNWNAEPEQVVPLAEVEETPPTDRADTPTVEREPPVGLRSTINADHVFSSKDAVTPFAFLLRPSIALAVCLALLVGLAVAATALRWKVKSRQQAAQVAAAVESEPSAHPDAQPVPTSSVPDSRGAAKQVVEDSPSGAASQQQNTSKRQNASRQQNTPARNVSRSPATSPATVNTARGERSEERDAIVRDLTGDWRIINTVEKTGYKSFDRMQVGFRLKINQRGKQFTAHGEKFSENGQTLPAGNRTPIYLQGSIEGDKVVATFVEEGRARKTNGRFVWKLQSGGDALTGTFVTTAANSSGRSAVMKQ